VLVVAGVAALSGSAAGLSASGVKDDPQPELAAFSLGSGAGPGGGTVAASPGGVRTVAYVLKGVPGSVRVCEVPPNARSCKNAVTLKPESPDDVFGVPQVFVNGTDVYVLVGAGATHGDLLFLSTDGGASFSAGRLVGDAITPSAAAIVGDQLVFSEGDDSAGVQVAAVSLVSPAPPAAIANPSTTGGTVGVGSYNGGVLVAGDNAGSGPTKVEYAPSSSDFTATSSYMNVGTFSGESLIGMSGNALLTQKTSGSESLQLRFFTGTAFGAAHTVPGSSGGGPEWFTLDKSPGGVTHVFMSDSRTHEIYQLEEYSTTSGSSWTGPVGLANATRSDFLAAGVDSTGAGLVLGDSPALAYPVLVPQHVTFEIKPSTVTKGHSAKASGKVSPASKGRKVELQIEHSGRWYDVKSTTESSTGTFSFTIKGKSVGTSTYRAVAADRAGFDEFGYSSARSLHVKK
jgi:hypothetical protein